MMILLSLKVLLYFELRTVMLNIPHSPYFIIPTSNATHYKYMKTLCDYLKMGRNKSCEDFEHRNYIEPPAGFEPATD